MKTNYTNAVNRRILLWIPFLVCVACSTSEVAFTTDRSSAHLVTQAEVFLLQDSLVHNSQCDKPALYPGGELALMEFLAANLQWPPELWSERNTRLTVMTGFIIENDGTITNLHYINGDKVLLPEALRIIRLMPPWIPGEIDNTPVRTYYTLPFFYQME